MAQVIVELRSPAVCPRPAVDPEEPVLLFHPKSEGPRTRRTGGISPGPDLGAGDWCARHSASQAESENSHFSRVFVLFRLSMDWITFPRTQKSICFTESTNLNANLLQVNSLRRTQEYCSAKHIWVHPGLVELTDKVTITESLP